MYDKIEEITFFSGGVTMGRS